MNLLAVAALAAAAWGATESAANFGGSLGFSGQAGFTCAACHQPPSPLAGPAQAHLEGLPETWNPQETYRLRIRVTGGPDPLPPPQAQGGFGLATSAGVLRGALDESLFHQVEPTEITYSAAGTQMREWSVEWAAPGLETRPEPVRFWLAVLAANGNHIIALGRADGGETLDSAAHLETAVPPSPAALEAWRALPLRAPRAELTALPDGSWAILGSHEDANATHLAYRLDGGPWRSRETAPSWRLAVPSGAAVVEYRSEGLERESPVQSQALPRPESVASPVAFHPAWLLLLANFRRRT